MILLLIAVLVVSVVAYSLRRRGRPWYRNSYSQRWIDGWTATHFGHGLVAFGLAKMLLHWPNAELLAVVIAAEALWESFENRNWVINFFRGAGDKGYFGDSIANSAGDLAACTLGALVMTFLI